MSNTVGARSIVIFSFHKIIWVGKWDVIIERRKVKQYHHSLKNSCAHEEPLVFLNRRHVQRACCNATQSIPNYTPSLCHVSISGEKKLLAGKPTVLSRHIEKLLRVKAKCTREHNLAVDKWKLAKHDETLTGWFRNEIADHIVLFVI